MDQGLFANLAAFVAISPSLGLLSERLQLKRVVPVAVDRAICEVGRPPCTYESLKTAVTWELLTEMVCCVADVC